MAAKIDAMIADFRAKELRATRTIAFARTKMLSDISRAFSDAQIDTIIKRKRDRAHNDIVEREPLMAEVEILVDAKAHRRFATMADGLAPKGKK